MYSANTTIKYKDSIAEAVQKFNSKILAKLEKIELVWKRKHWIKSQ